MNKLGFFPFIFLLACGAADHKKEVKAVCDHIEGFNACNAGDNFSPLTCQDSLLQFEAWWRGDAQTNINNCMANYVCQLSPPDPPGPSISISLATCMNNELYTNLTPTDKENDAVSKWCKKADNCDLLGQFTESDCITYLLSPYDDGQLFLMMNDALAVSVANCENALCVDFGNCVNAAFSKYAVFNNLSGVGIKMPNLIKNMQ